MTEPQSAVEPVGRGQSVTGWIQIVLVVVVLVGALAANRVLSRGGDGGPPITAAAALPAVTIMQPVFASDAVRVTETGSVRTRANVTIAPQVGGRVVAASPDFAAGGSFAAGDVLFAIDPTDYELGVQQAEADLASALSVLQLEEAEAETARREWRLINGDDPIPPLVARAPQIAQAEANVAAARARAADARTALERTRYVLPFDGRVVRTTIEVGQTVAANQPYGEVYNAGALEVFVSIPTDALAALEPAVGRSALVRGAGADGGVQASARVSRVEAELDAQTRLAGLVLTFDAPPPFLPGAFVRVDVRGDEVEDVFRAPADAVAAGGIVWVVDDGVLAARRPAIVSRQDDAVLLARFDPADGVVTTLPPGAREGLPVLVVNAQISPANALAAAE